VDHTTATDSLGIVTLATAAFKRGRLSKSDVDTINECADGFTRVLSLANRCRQTGKSLPLDQVPSPTGLRRHLEKEDFNSAVAEAMAIRKQLESVFQAAEQQLRAP
jgi:hypothetical protein